MTFLKCFLKKILLYFLFLFPCVSQQVSLNINGADELSLTSNNFSAVPFVMIVVIGAEKYVFLNI